MKSQAEALTFDLSEFLPFQMSVISDQLFNRVIARASLQLPEWRILMALPANQPCSSHDLCVLTDMDAARVSRAQRRLEQLDLVSVVRDEADRRRLEVRLSEAGYEKVTTLRKEAQAAESKMLDALGPDGRAQLRTALGGLFEQLGAQ